MISILTTKFKRCLNHEKFRLYCDALPKPMVDKTLRFRRWQDAHCSLFGKLLLMKGLNKFGFSEINLNQLKYYKYDRPYFEYPIDFNISHAGNIVLCALSDEGKVGIDIEIKNHIETQEFQNIWTDEEQKNIENSGDKIRQFYYYWTKKEAVIKADGRGLNLALNKISVIDNYADLGDKIWYLYPLEMDGDYAAHLATNKKVNDNLEIQTVYF